MKIISRSFSYSCKKSINYDSYSVSEGFEAEITCPEDNDEFNNHKRAIVLNVQSKLDSVMPKPNKPGKDLLG